MSLDKKITGVANIHFAAKHGDLARLRKILKKNPHKIETFDSDGWTPLFYAACSQQKAATRYLLKRGARYDITDNGQSNIIDYAKQNGKHTRVSRFLKKHIGLNQTILAGFATSFRGILEKELLIARENNKKILVMLGEDHGHYQTYQLEKVMLKVANEFGLGTLFTESPTANASDFPIDSIAKHKLGMTIVGVDKCSRKYKPTLEQRNRIMAQEINRINKDGVLITGSNHLYGLLEQQETKIDLQKYHAIPINLSSVVVMGYKDESPESLFSNASSKVIQIRSHHFTDAKRVSEKWNSASPSPSLRAAACPRHPEVAMDTADPTTLKRLRRAGKPRYVGFKV